MIRIILKFGFPRFSKPFFGSLASSAFAADLKNPKSRKCIFLNAKIAAVG
jgi:hypothetical protein